MVSAADDRTLKVASYYILGTNVLCCTAVESGLRQQIGHSTVTQ